MDFFIKRIINIGKQCPIITKGMHINNWNHGRRSAKAIITKSVHILQLGLGPSPQSRLYFPDFVGSNLLNKF